MSNTDLKAAAQAVSLQASEVPGVGVPILSEELLDFIGAFEETAISADENYPEEYEGE